jgi:hypothetical protein
MRPREILLAPPPGLCWVGGATAGERDGTVTYVSWGSQIHSLRGMGGSLLKPELGHYL